MNDLQAGALAGCMATLPMTMVMEELHERLPWWQQYVLPPRQIAMNAAHAVGVRQNLDERERLAATLVAHFAVGTTAGAIYGPVSRHLPGPPLLSGAAFGLAVWGANYLAILPALRLLDPATDHPPQRTGLMIAAHLVWGAATGLLTSAMRKQKTQSHPRAGRTHRNEGHVLRQK